MFYSMFSWGGLKNSVLMFTYPGGVEPETRPLPKHHPRGTRPGNLHNTLIINKIYVIKHVKKFGNWKNGVYLCSRF
jgi:hypothetical protein